MLEHVPDGHILHLVHKRLPASEREHAVQTLNMFGAKVGVLDLIEKHEPGVTERLNKAWVYQGGKSAFLYRCPSLMELGAVKVRAAAVQRFGPLKDGTRNVIEPPDEPVHDRVAAIRFDGKTVTVGVRVTIPREVQVDTVDGTETVDTYTSVDVRADIATGLVEAFGSYQHARKAVKALLRLFVGGLPTTDTSRLWSTKWMMAVAFTETQVAKFAANNKFEFVNIKGPDPEDEFGSVEYDAKVEKHQEVPFGKEARILRQVKEENAHRTYNGTFTHEDGFPEVFKVRFTLNGQLSHLTFVNRTSIDAIRWLIDSFVATL